MEGSEAVEPDFDICWNCRTGVSGEAPPPDFGVDEQPKATGRLISCLRCDQPMQFGGVKRFPAGSRMARSSATIPQPNCGW